MPFKSEKQRRFLWAEHPEIAKRWAHEYPESNKNLPMYAKNKDDKAKVASTSKNSSNFNVPAILSQIEGGLRGTSPSILAEKVSENSKKADSKQEKVDIPHTAEPTYAGEEREKGQISTDTSNSTDNCAEKPKNAINELLQKLSVVLSPAIEQTIENMNAENEGRVPVRVGKNRGLKQYPQATPSIPLPMGMAQAQAPAQPQQAQQKQPASPTPVGAGQSSATTDPIKFHSGLSASGIINGNAALSAPNTVNTKISAAGNPIQSWLMGMEHIDTETTLDILAEERVKSAVEKWADVVYTGNDAQVIKEHDEREKAIADWEKKWNMKWEDYVPSWERNKKPRVKKSADTPAWQRAAGKNDEGGLNAKGRASYNRETGGNLKAPVTEKNPKGERNKRQNSFCSRMCGMKKHETGSKTKKDPESRINKALRKWNCKCSAAENFGKKLAGAGGGRAIGHALEEEGVDPAVAALAGLAAMGGLYGVYHGGKKLLAPVAKRLSVSTLPDDQIGPIALPTNPKRPDDLYTFAERYRQPSMLGSLFIDSDEDAISRAITQVTNRNPAMLQRLENQSGSTGDLDSIGKTLVEKYPHRYRLPEKAAAKRVLNLSPSWGGQKWQLGEWGLNPQAGYRYLGGVVPTPDIALRLGGPMGGTAVGLAPFPYVETDWGRPAGRQANKETRSLYKWIADGMRDRPTAAAHALANLPGDATAEDYEAAMRSSGVGYSSKELKRMADRMAKMGPLQLPVE